MHLWARTGNQTGPMQMKMFHFAHKAQYYSIVSVRQDLVCEDWGFVDGFTVHGLWAPIFLFLRGLRVVVQSASSSLQSHPLRRALVCSRTWRLLVSEHVMGAYNYGGSFRRRRATNDRQNTPARRAPSYQRRMCRQFSVLFCAKLGGLANKCNGQVVFEQQFYPNAIHQQRRKRNKRNTVACGTHAHRPTGKRAGISIILHAVVHKRRTSQHLYSTESCHVVSSIFDMRNIGYEWWIIIATNETEPEHSFPFCLFAGV